MTQNESTLAALLGASQRSCERALRLRLRLLRLLRLRLLRLLRLRLRLRPLSDAEAQTQAGWLATNVTEVSLPTTGRLPAMPIDFLVSLSVSTHRNPHHNWMPWTDACGRSSGGVAARAVARSAS